MIGYFIMGATFAFAAAVQPGPLMTYIVSQTLEKGWRKTLPASFAPVLSDAPIIIVALIILSSIPGWFVQSLHLAGALVLFYFAYGAFKSWRNYDENRIVKNDRASKTLLGAVMVNLVNPNPYLGWSLVMGPLFLEGYKESPFNSIALLGGFYITFTVVTMVLIFLFAFARNLGPRVNKVMLGISVLALAGFGIYQLYLGLNTI